MKVPPGATKPWVAFFPVPKGASGMKLIATDLKFRDAARAELPLPDALPSGNSNRRRARAPGRPPGRCAPAAGHARRRPAQRDHHQLVAGVWTLDEPFSKQAADGNTAGLMSLGLRSCRTAHLWQCMGSREVEGDGGQVPITFDGSAGTRSDEVAALTGIGVKWPSPSETQVLLENSEEWCPGP